MRTCKLFATLAVAAALAPATARAQSGDADKSKDVGKYLDRSSKESQKTIRREIDVSADDADLRDVMDEIGRRVDKNIIVEPDIHEKVTITLRKIPWETAVEVIAKQAKCEVERKGAILLLTQPPKVTIQFTDANVRTVLQLLAAYSGKNIIISPDVKGEVTLDLHDVHWLKALYAIVRTIPGNFEVVEDTPELLRVVPSSSIAQQLKVVDIPLHYLRPPVKYLATPPKTSVSTGNVATATANLFLSAPKAPSGQPDEFTLYKALQGIVNSTKAQGVQGCALEYDAQKNAFIVRGTQPLIDEIKGIVARLDQEPPQIYVEVRFVSTSDNNFLEHGIRPADPLNGISLSGPFPAQNSTASTVVSGKAVQINSAGGTNNIPNSTNIITVPQSIGGVPVGTFPFTFGTGLDNFTSAFAVPGVLDFRGLQTTLNLIDRDTRSRLLQTPSLFVRDHEDAVIFVGENVPFAQVNSTPDLNGNVVQTIGQGAGSPIAIGFSLFISAHVVPETDRIMMTVIPRVSSPGGTTAAGPGGVLVFDSFTIGAGAQTQTILLPHTREQALVTHIMVDDGNTAVIGGLLTEQNNETITRIPIISRIPVIGNLFTHTHKEKTVSNLLILVTTTIVRTRAQSMALWRRHDTQWKERDYFWKTYEQPREEARARGEDTSKADRRAPLNLPPSPPPPAPPSGPSTPAGEGGSVPPSGGGADEKK